MKTALFCLALMSFGAFADWDETVTCEIQRLSVDLGIEAKSNSTATLHMSGPHNGETGSVQIENSLVPSYDIVFEKLSGGRLERQSLTTTLGGRTMALSTVDTQFSETVSNTFLTDGSDYQIKVSCSAKILR